MAYHAGHFFHAHSVDLPFFVTPEAGVLVRPEIMHVTDMAALAFHLLGKDMPRMSR